MLGPSLRMQKKLEYPPGHLSRTCKTRHWLSAFKLAVPLFHFTLRLKRHYDYILNTKLFYFLDYKKIQFF